MDIANQIYTAPLSAHAAPHSLLPSFPSDAPPNPPPSLCPRYPLSFPLPSRSLSPSGQAPSLRGCPAVLLSPVSVACVQGCDASPTPPMCPLEFYFKSCSPNNTPLDGLLPAALPQHHTAQRCPPVTRLTASCVDRGCWGWLCFPG